MKRGDIKQGRVMASKSTENKAFKELVEEFLRNAEVRGLSEWTIKSYKHHVGYFLSFAGEELLCSDIELEIVQDYILYMRQNKGITNPVTLNSYVRNLSPILKFGIKKRYILRDFQIPEIRGQETFKK